MPSVVRLVVVTENTDPNNMIGRPTGYTAAVVIYDKRVTCSHGLGVDCGAATEQWRTPAEARQRMEYIQSALKSAPILGSEYDYLVGPVLVRVSGELKPSQAKVYERAVK